VEAIAHDTPSPMAYRKLAVVLSNSSAAPSRIAAAATKAFQHRDRLTPLERYLAEAYYYNVAEFDRAKLQGAYRAVLELDPENLVALNNLALSLTEVRKFAEAESLALRGIALYPNDGPVNLSTTGALVAQGKLTDAAR